MKLIFGNGLKLRGRNADEAMQVTVLPITSPTSQAGLTQTTVDDIVYDHIADVTQQQLFELVTLNAAGTATVSSEDAAVATVTDGKITLVSDGMARITVSDDRDDVIVEHPVFQSVASSAYNEFNSYEASSLCRHIFDEVATRINGLTSSDTTDNIFTPASQNQTANDLVRNPSLWCADLDLSGIGMEIGKAATAISPRHVFSATHYRPSGSIEFVLNDNSVITRNVTNWQSVGTTDLAIGYLDADLPAEVKKYKVLPANYLTYLPGMFEHLPIVNTSHSGSGWGVNRFMRVQEVDSITSGTMSTKAVGNMLEEFIPWHVPFGLSGEPVFLIISGELIPIAENWGRWGYTSNACKFISDYITEINTIMSNQHGDATHQLQEVDLSGFTAF